MTSLGLATFTLASWLSLLQHPAVELPRLVVHEAQMVVSQPPVQKVIAKALGLLGTKYKRGGSDPAQGIDCSRLVRLAYSTIGIELPQSAATQIQVGEEIARDQIQPGDLVFFRNTYKRGISHVGIALGDDLFVHAASYKHGVIVSSLQNSYFRPRFAGARRLAGALAAAFAPLETELAESPVPAPAPTPTGVVIASSPK